MSQVFFPVDVSQRYMLGWNGGSAGKVLRRRLQHRRISSGKSGEISGIAGQEGVDDGSMGGSLTFAARHTVHARAPRETAGFVSGESPSGSWWCRSLGMARKAEAAGLRSGLAGWLDRQEAGG